MPWCLHVLLDDWSPLGTPEHTLSSPYPYASIPERTKRGSTYDFATDALRDKVRWRATALRGNHMVAVDDALSVAAVG